MPLIGENAYEKKMEREMEESEGHGRGWGNCHQ
jgi:hypothetical protein